jgi:hypothetical protein
LVEPAIQDMSVVNAAVPNLGRRWTVPGECGARDTAIFCGFGERQAALFDVGGKAGHLSDLYKLRTDSLAGGLWSRRAPGINPRRFGGFDGRGDIALAEGRGAAGHGAYSEIQSVLGPVAAEATGHAVQRGHLVSRTLFCRG